MDKNKMSFFRGQTYPYYSNALLGCAKEFGSTCTTYRTSYNFMAYYEQQIIAAIFISLGREPVKRELPFSF